MKFINIKQKSFFEIRNFYNSLDKDYSHFYNSNDICTPLDCVKEMVDYIPVELWKRSNLKVLDCCCGNGNFHSYIQTKTDLRNLIFNDINEKRLNNLSKIFGKDITIRNKDFLTFDNQEKYDLVVSNPPYAKFNEGKRVSKNHNMSRDFISKAIDIIKENGYILFICPNNWQSYSDRNILPELLSSYQFIHININGAKKYFPKVGSSFTWFVLQKKKNKKKFSVANNYILQSKEWVKIDKKVKFIPLYFSDVVQSILNKTLLSSGDKYKIETTSNLHRYTKKDFLSEKKTDIFKYKIIHTPTQTLWSKIRHQYQSGWKVFISLTNQYKTFIDNCGMTQSIAFVRCDSLEIAEKIKQELDNDIYKFLNNITRYGNFNNIRVLQLFPVWKDFRLSKKEYHLIEKFNNIYYKKNKTTPMLNFI